MAIWTVSVWLIPTVRTRKTPQFSASKNLQNHHSQWFEEFIFNLHTGGNVNTGDWIKSRKSRGDVSMTVCWIWYNTRYIWGAVKIYYNCLVCFWRVIVFGGAISFYRVLLFSAPSFTFISHRGSGSGSSSSSSNNFNASKHLLLKRLWPSHRASLLSRGQFSTKGYR